MCLWGMIVYSVPKNHGLSFQNSETGYLVMRNVIGVVKQIHKCSVESNYLASVFLRELSLSVLIISLVLISFKWFNNRLTSSSMPSEIFFAWSASRDEIVSHFYTQLITNTSSWTYYYFDNHFTYWLSLCCKSAVRQYTIFMHIKWMMHHLACLSGFATISVNEWNPRTNCFPRLPPQTPKT